MCASHSGFEAHKGLEICIRVPDRAFDIRINCVMGCTPWCCETPQGTFPARFAISQSLHHETVSL